MSWTAVCTLALAAGMLVFLASARLPRLRAWRRPVRREQVVSYVRPQLVAALLVVAALLSPTVSVVRASTLDTPPETIAQLAVPLDVVVYEPCRDEEVELEGTLTIQGSIIASEEGTIELQYALQAADVHGSGLETGARYDFVGESHGVTSRLGRLVSADDFQVIAQREPGVEVDRVCVEPRSTVTLSVTFSEKGTIEAVVPASVLTDEKCL
jgi:hypothetical protein